MCNRYVSPDEAAIERFWQIGRKNPMRWWKPDVFPRAAGPFIRRGGELVVGQWGLIPFFAKSAVLPYSRLRKADHATNLHWHYPGCCKF